MTVAVRRAPATAARTTPPARPTNIASSTVACQRRRSSARARTHTAVITATFRRERHEPESRSWPGITRQRRVAGRVSLTVGDAAVAHPGDPLGGRGHLLVVGDQQDGLAAGVETPEQLHDLGAAGRVERAGGLVSQQHGRLVGKGPGDGQPLTLAAGQDPGDAAALVAEAEEVK